MKINMQDSFFAHSCEIWLRKGSSLRLFNGSRVQYFNGTGATHLPG
jgi:hypothetical protein